MGIKQIGINQMGILVNGFIKANRLIVAVPLPLSAEITTANKNKVAITFSQNLNLTSIPATTAFVLAGKTITNVAIIGAVVTLTVSVAYAFGNSGITVDYTKPLINPLLSLTGGREAPSFVGQSVINNISNPYGPELMDQNDWWNAPYWNLFGSSLSTVGHTIVADGSYVGGILYKFAFWDAGKTYLVSWTVNVISGTFFIGSDGFGPWAGFSTISESRSELVTLPAGGLFMAYTNNWLGSLTAMSVKELLP